MDTILLMCLPNYEYIFEVNNQQTIDFGWTSQVSKLLYTKQARAF